MDDNRIHLDLHTTRDQFEDQDEVEVEVGFEIPVDSRLRPLSITGIALHAVGLLMFLAMAVLLVVTGPGTWFNWDGDLEAAQTLKERVTVLGLVGGAFLFTGLALYTYGRTVRGGEALSEGGAVE